MSSQSRWHDALVRCTCTADGSPSGTGRSTTCPRYASGWPRNSPGATPTAPTRAGRRKRHRPSSSTGSPCSPPCPGRPAHPEGEPRRGRAADDALLGQATGTGRRATDWRRMGLAIYDQRVWGRGYGSAALALWTGYLFDTTDTLRLDYATYSGNPGMIAVGRSSVSPGSRCRQARRWSGGVHDAIVSACCGRMASSDQSIERNVSACLATGPRSVHSGTHRWGPGERSARCSACRADLPSCWSHSPQDNPCRWHVHDRGHVAEQGLVGGGEGLLRRVLRPLCALAVVFLAKRRTLWAWPVQLGATVLSSPSTPPPNSAAWPVDRT